MRTRIFVASAAFPDDRSASKMMGRIFLTTDFTDTTDEFNYPIVPSASGFPEKHPCYPWNPWLNLVPASKLQVLHREPVVDELLQGIDADAEVHRDMPVVDGLVAFGGLHALRRHRFVGHEQEG